MLYRLETPDGQTRKFHIEACAILYQGVYGGIVYLQEDSTIDDPEEPHADIIDLNLSS